MNPKILSGLYKTFAVFGYLSVIYFAVLVIKNEYGNYMQHIEVLSWRKTPGTITSSVKTHHEGPRRKKFRHRWCTTVKYFYILEEVSYSSSKRECFLLKQSSEKVAKKFTAGKSVEVYVNPTEKRESTIDPEYPYGFKDRYIFLAIIVIGLFIFWYLFLERMKPNEVKGEELQ